MKLIFEAGYDIADLGGLELAVVETGGNSFSVDVPALLWFLITSGATITEGDFTDIVDGHGSLLDEIVSQLNAGTGGGGLWVGAYSDVTERVTLALLVPGTVTAVSITPVAGGGLIGLTGAVSSAIPYACTGQRAPDYVIPAAMGFWSANTGEYEGGDDVAYDVEGHDGSPGGAAKEAAPTYLDLDVPSEPVARVGNFPALVEASAPWTWRDLWKHCRNVEPFLMRDDTGLTHALLLRAEGAKFKPRALGDNYVARWDIPILTRVLGRSA